MLKKLQLPPLQDHRRQLNSADHAVQDGGGLVPAPPPEHPVSKARRNIQASTYHNYNFDNPIIRQPANIRRGYIVPCTCKQDRSLETFFFFVVRTVYEWIQLSEETAHASSADAMTSAVSRTPQFEIPVCPLPSPSR